MRFIASIAVLLAIAGCASSPQDRNKRYAEVYEKLYGPNCVALGFKPDTEAYAECKLKLATAPR